MPRTLLHPVVIRVVALAALAGASLAAQAEPGVVFGGGGVGSFIPDDPELPTINGTGSASLLPDGSQIGHFTCINCSFNSLPIVVDTWYKRPNLPTTAAGQAYADFGVLKARSWRTDGPQGDSQTSNPPGTYTFLGGATAEWRDDLVYTGTVPTTVTMQFTLHAKWSNLGRFAFTFGRDLVGAENVRFIDGLSYMNCAGPVECGFSQFGSQPVEVPGNDAANSSGEVTLAINHSFVLLPQLPDPEDANSTQPDSFVAHLQTTSAAPGAEVDAFQTVTLDRILIEPGAQIGFASAHNWPVQVVPEPATRWLGLAGLVAVVPLARRRRPAA